MAQISDEILNRTHTCGQLRQSDLDMDVRLCGWVRSYRDHGGVVFVDLRDRDGITQVVFDLPQKGGVGGEAMYKLARSLRNEWVISAAGTVRHRGEDRINPKIATGQIEVVAHDLTVLNKSDTVPIEPDEYSQVSEDTRLRYRYIDLRRPEMTRAIRLRHQITRTMRRVLDEENFIEIETPFLTKSTPEGARDFLVPSRMQQTSFYALPQSPQLFKQILMVGGLDKYYQIVRCFRDEDLRADRQPEFTQLDMEMSFATEADVMNITNKVMSAVCELTDKPFPRQVPVMTYQEVIDKYGTDRPDIRFELFLHDVGDIVAGSEFKVFADALGGGGIIKALCPTGGGKLTRKEIDGCIDYARQHGAAGLAWCKVEKTRLAGGVAKFLTDQMQAELRRRLGADDGDIILFSADKPAAVDRVLAALRVKLGRDMNLFDKDAFAWCWVTEFPLVAWNADSQGWDSLHHPFTMPAVDDIEQLHKAPGDMKARAYDLVCNGQEMGGGSIRIHLPEVQRQVFGLLGIGPAEAQEKFGFLLDALRFGAPPHGGIALGLDRIVMELIGASSLRDVIAFPKTQRGTCPLTGAPAEVDGDQLAELDLRIIASPETSSQANQRT